jgi:threonine aldolase
MKKSYASDNNSGVHPSIMQAIVDANTDQFVSYGDDPYTEKAIAMFREIFGPDISVFFMLTGTGANVSALQSITDRFEAILCAESAHINIDECGAPEHVLGSKLIDIPTSDGKLTVTHLEKYLHYLGDQHHVQPRTVSITQSTEMGTLYTIADMRAIVDFAHKNGIKVHLDGARIANAAVALGCDLREMTTDIGIDVLSFGGTKNGAMMGEAIVVFDVKTGSILSQLADCVAEDSYATNRPFTDVSVAKSLPFIRKQNMQLLSKMRYVSAQFIAYLTDDLYLKNAKQANDMARYLYDRLLTTAPQITIYPPDVNAVFVKLPREIAEKMQSERFFYTWDESENIYRFMTNFEMTHADIDDFVEFISKYIY